MTFSGLDTSGSSNYRVVETNPGTYFGGSIVVHPEVATTTNVTNGRIIRFDDRTTSEKAADCTFTNTAAGGTITAHKGGTRNTGSNAVDTFANGLAGATFEYANNSNFTGATAPLRHPRLDRRDRRVRLGADRQRQLLGAGEDRAGRLEHDSATSRTAATPSARARSSPTTSRSPSTTRTRPRVAS